MNQSVDEKTMERVQLTDLRTKKLIQDDLIEKRGSLLRRINSYESSLNCNMTCCLKQIKELNNHGSGSKLTTIAANSISMELLPSRKRNKVAIQREPYLDDVFSYTNAQLVRLTSKRQPNGQVQSERLSSSNSSSSGLFSTGKLSKLSASSSNSALLNYEEMKNSKNASIKSWASMLSVVKQNDQNRMSSQDSVRNPLSLCELAKSCYR